MKYLKTLETFDFEPKYELGDYVLIENSIARIQSSNFAILGFKKETTYYVESFFKDKLKYFNVDEDDIKRKATNEEIKDYEMKKSTIQYNL